MGQLLIMATPVSVSVVGMIEAALCAAGHRCQVRVMDREDPPADMPEGPWDVVVAAGAPCGAALMAAPSLRAVISPFIGYDSVDMAAAAANTILVANGRTPENAESMAEATIMLMLAVSYDLPGSIARMADSQARHVRPTMLRGRTIGIVGFGAIARAVIDRLAGWGVTILVSSGVAAGRIDGVARLVPLDLLLAQSDLVLVLTHLTPANHHLLDAAALDRMKPGAMIVNTARGAIIDEAALAERLASGRLRGAALDVFAVEPLPGTSPLRTLDNVILTPHCAGHTAESLGAVTGALLDNVAAVLAGRVPDAVCNPDVSAAWQARWGAGGELPDA